MSKKFTVHSVIICDDIRSEANGKQMIFGIYDDEILTAAVPAILPKLCIRIAVIVPGAHPKNVSFEVRPAGGGDAIFEHRGPLGPNKAQAMGGVRRYAMVFNTQPCIFPKAGKFNVSFGLDGSPRKVAEFNVRLPRNDAERNLLPKQT